MFYKVLSALAIAEIAWGTVLSVLCILGMSLTDIMKTSTHGGLSNRWIETLQQRHYARCGISFIVFGSLLQIFLVFVNEINSNVFWIILAIVLVIPIIVCVLSTIDYISTKKNGWQKKED